jgi:hypothetical protein
MATNMLGVLSYRLKEIAWHTRPKILLAPEHFFLAKSLYYGRIVGFRKNKRKYFAAFSASYTLTTSTIFWRNNPMRSSFNSKMYSGSWI